MQKWTQALSKAVNNGVTKFVSSGKTSYAGCIPRDPLEGDRVELEILLNVLSALYENLQWFLVTLSNFSLQYDYVHSLIRASEAPAMEELNGVAALSNDLAVCLSRYVNSALELQEECESNAEEVRDAIDICDNLIGDIAQMLKRFTDRKEMFQDAVQNQVKANRLDTESHKEGVSAPHLDKAAERYRKKANDIKATFKKQNAQLMTDVQELLRRARMEKAELLCLFFRNQQVLARRLTRGYSHLEEPYAAMRDQIATNDHNNFCPKSSAETELEGDGLTKKNEHHQPSAVPLMKGRSASLPAASPDSHEMMTSAQIFLLTDRKFESSHFSEEMANGRSRTGYFSNAVSELSMTEEDTTEDEAPSLPQPSWRREPSKRVVPPIPILITKSPPSQQTTLEPALQQSGYLGLRGNTEGDELLSPPLRSVRSIVKTHFIESVGSKEPRLHASTTMPLTPSSRTYSPGRTPLMSALGSPPPSLDLGSSVRGSPFGASPFEASPFGSLCSSSRKSASGISNPDQFSPPPRSVLKSLT